MTDKRCDLCRHSINTPMFAKVWCWLLNRYQAPADKCDKFQVR